MMNVRVREERITVQRIETRATSRLSLQRSLLTWSVRGRAQARDDIADALQCTSQDVITLFGHGPFACGQGCVMATVPDVGMEREVADEVGVCLDVRLVGVCECWVNGCAGGEEG